MHDINMILYIVDNQSFIDKLSFLKNSIFDKSSKGLLTRFRKKVYTYEKYIFAVSNLYLCSVSIEKTLHMRKVRLFHAEAISNCISNETVLKLN